MTTLYDLLGALPGDDADDLRDAFRRAVKDVHPDIRPNDPDAALNFRLIVYAMEVLRDPEQRAAYDYLLDLARQELVSQRRAAKIRTFAFAMIGLASASVVVISAVGLFAPTLLPWFRQIDELPHASTKTAPSSGSAGPASNENGATANPDTATTKAAEEQNDFVSRWGTNDINANADPPPAKTGPPAQQPEDLPPPSDARDNNAPADRNAETAMKEQESPVVHPSGPNLPEQRDAADDATAHLAPDDNTDPSAAIHAKGIAAYRKGDLDAALADLSRAIELNPRFMLAYINRGIVLYRMGKLDLALADVARAKRIDRAGHGRPVAAVHGKRRRDTSATRNRPSMPAAGS
jgi:curved DNA-binding protein CbpA